MSKARAKAMTGARMTEAAPQAVMQQADALLKRWMRGASLQTMEDSQHLGQNDAVRLVVALAEALTTTAQQARAAERERGQPLLDALRPLVTKWASSGRQTADRALVSTLFYARLRQMAPCAHRWTTWSDGTGMQESCTVCGLRRFA